MENKILNWLKDELKEFKDELKFFRNESLPRLHNRIDEIMIKVSRLEGKMIISKYLYIIIILLILGILALAGIKNLPNFEKFFS
jgi:hypothetical protein